jgi:hypothetical protein
MKGCTTTLKEIACAVEQWPEKQTKQNIMKLTFHAYIYSINLI